MRLFLLVAALILCAAPLAAQPGESSNAEPRLRFTLSGALVSGQSTTDWAFLRFLPDALPGWDQHDGSKFSSAPSQIAFVGRRDRHVVRLGMNSLPDGTSAPLRHSFNVKMKMMTTTDGTFTLSWDGALSPGWRTTLVDRSTGATVKMWRETSYTFHMKHAEWTDRFFVRVRPAPVSALIATAPEASLLTLTSEIGQPYPNPASGAARLSVALAEEQAVRVSIVDALGREVAVAHDGPLAAGPHALALPTDALPAGAYVVRITGDGLSDTRRLTVSR